MTARYFSCDVFLRKGEDEIRRLLLWFVLLLTLQYFFKDRRHRPNRASAPRGGDGGGEFETLNKAAKERFEFKKRQALAAGSMGYIWRTPKEGQCPAHQNLEGRFVPWDNPPVISGVPTHAGERADCACDTEVIN